jgi:hypothetical protein
MNRYLRPNVFSLIVALLWVADAHADQGEQATGVANDAASDAAYLPGQFETGLGLRFMPVGWFDMYDVANRDFRAYPALGFAPFLDYRLGRYFAVGISPELTLNVVPNRSDYHGGEMLTFAARLQGRYPVQEHIEPYAIATAGYSVIWRADTSAASGPAVGGSLGLRLRFAKRHAVFAELSYQRGFQRVDGQAYSPSYLITGAGWQVGL